MGLVKKYIHPDPLLYLHSNWRSVTPSSSRCGYAWASPSPECHPESTICKARIPLLATSYTPSHISRPYTPQRLSLWYPKHMLQWRFGLFWGGATCSGAFSGLIAYGISFMSGTDGLLGWSWIFVRVLRTLRLYGTAYSPHIVQDRRRPRDSSRCDPCVFRQVPSIHNALST